MRTTRLSISMDYLFTKYRSLDVRNRLEYGYPFAIAHRNISDYVYGYDPILVSDVAGLRRAEQQWRKMVDHIRRYADGSVRVGRRLIAIGFLYPNTYAVASEPPAIPRIPELFGIVGDEVLIVRRSSIPNPRSVYIEMLRYLARAVVVKPLSVYRP